MCVCVWTPLTSPRVSVGWLWRRPEASTCYLERAGPRLLLLTSLTPAVLLSPGPWDHYDPSQRSSTLPGSHSWPHSKAPAALKLWDILQGSPCSSVDKARDASRVGAVAARRPCTLGSFPGFGVTSWKLSRSPSRGRGSSVRPEPTRAPAPTSPLRGVLTVLTPNLLPHRQV